MPTKAEKMAEKKAERKRLRRHRSELRLKAWRDQRAQLMHERRQMQVRWAVQMQVRWAVQMQVRWAVQMQAAAENGLDSDYVLITEKFIVQGRTGPGGWKAAQLALIGIPWPPSKGWQGIVIGGAIPKTDADHFLALKQRV